MRCVIHIGTEKTGSSVLQDWLYDNAGALRAVGFHLTTSFGVPNNRHFPAYFRKEPDDFSREHQLNSAEEKREFFKSFQEDFAVEMQAARDCHTVVITSEHFHSRLTEFEEVSAFKAFLDENFDAIEIVCYFREQSDMALSSYSTYLRDGGREDIDTVMKDVTPQIYCYNFLEIANLWSGVFGRDRCSFRIYDRHRFKSEDIRVDFLEAIGGYAFEPSLSFKVRKSNPSLSRLQAVAFQEINKVVPFWKQEGGKNRQNLRLKRSILKLPALTRGRISFPSQDEVAERFKESNQIFFETYLPGEASFSYKFRTQASVVEITESELADVVASVSQCFLDEIRRSSQKKRQEKLEISALVKWRQIADYRIHKWLSETPLVTENVRRRFRGPAERRERKLKSER